MSMYTTIFVPDLGGLPKATVLEVPVNIGQAVALDQTVIVLETEQFVLEIPSRVEGYVAAIDAQLGQTVLPGDTLLALSETCDRETHSNHSKSEDSYQNATRSETPPTNPSYVPAVLNKYQKIVLTVTSGLAIIAILFPPFVDITRGSRFHGYYPLFSVPENLYLSIHVGLLALEEVVILSVGGILCLVLKGSGEKPSFDRETNKPSETDRNTGGPSTANAFGKAVSRKLKTTFAFIGKWWWVPLVLAAVLRMMKI